jgi:alpha-tubulin suppressor-like RCC1 family protein
VFASGINNRGQLGNGTTTATGANNPGYVLDNAGAHLALTNITKVKAYASSHNDTNVYHGVYFINDVGISYACGYNGSAFVGDNSTTDMPYAKEMTELSALTPTVLNLWSSSPVHGAHVALLSDNTVRVWGRYNNDGALGQGDTLGELEPVQPIDIDDNFIADVIDVRLSGTPASTDANTETTMYLLLSSGKVLGSGYNGVGQLGIGYISESEEKFTPMLGTSLNGVNDIASIGTCGFDHEGAFFVLKTNGTLWVTGKNTEGQMGTDEAVDTIRRKLVRVRLET